MKLNVIVPLSRPAMLPNVIENFVRQRYQNKSLVIVQNGPGLGTCQRYGFQPDALIDISTTHQSHAKNAALEYLLDKGESYFATFDDDDYYGEAYLDSIADGLKRGYDVVGKASIFIRFEDNRMVFVPQEGSCCEVNCINGPTISGVLSKAMPMFKEMIWGEDIDWVGTMIAFGAKVWAADRHSFCWMRRGHAHGHTYKITDVGLENTLRALGETYDCGFFDRQVVDGVVAPARFDRMPEQELSFEDHPVVQLWANSKEQWNGKSEGSSGSGSETGHL